MKNYNIIKKLCVKFTKSSHSNSAASVHVHYMDNSTFFFDF